MNLNHHPMDYNEPVTVAKMTYILIVVPFRKWLHNFDSLCHNIQWLNVVDFPSEKILRQIVEHEVYDVF